MSTIFIFSLGAAVSSAGAVMSVAIGRTHWSIGLCFVAWTVMASVFFGLWHKATHP